MKPREEAPVSADPTTPTAPTRPSALGFLTRLTITGRLVLGFATVLGLLSVIVISGVVLGARQQAKVHQVEAAEKSVSHALEMKFLAADVNGWQTGYALKMALGRPATAERASFEKSAATFQRSIGEEVASTSGAARDRAAAVKASFDQFMALDARIWSLFQKGTDEARAEADGLVLGEAITLFTKVADGTKGLADAAQAESTAAMNGANSMANLTRTLTIVLGLVSLGLGALLAFLIAQSIRKPVIALQSRMADIADGEGDLTQRVDEDGRDELAAVGRAFNRFVAQIQDIVQRVQEAAQSQGTRAQSVSQSSGQSREAVAQIAATIEDVARGASDQAESSQQVAESIEEMVRVVNDVAHGGEAAAQAAEHAHRTAAEGSQVVAEAQAAMSRIADEVAAASTIVDSLGERGQAIGNIVTAIDEIASQTNLLALNAAIEAARAGDHGRGFAVVADEVRALAEESQSAAASIAQIISEIREETQRGVTAMQSGRDEVERGVQQVALAGNAFGEIRASVESVAAEVSRVANGVGALEGGARSAQEHVSAVAAVSQENAAATEEVSASTEETAAAAEEVASSANSLEESARDLASMVARFRV